MNSPYAVALSSWLRCLANVVWAQVCDPKSIPPPPKNLAALLLPFYSCDTITIATIGLVLFHWILVADVINREKERWQRCSPWTLAGVVSSIALANVFLKDSAVVWLEVCPIVTDGCLLFYLGREIIRYVSSA